MFFFLQILNIFYRFAINWFILINQLTALYNYIELLFFSSCLSNQKTTHLLILTRYDNKCLPQNAHFLFSSHLQGMLLSCCKRNLMLPFKPRYVQTHFSHCHQIRLNLSQFSDQVSHDCLYLPNMPKYKMNAFFIYFPSLAKFV